MEKYWEAISEYVKKIPKFKSQWFSKENDNIGLCPNELMN